MKTKILSANQRIVIGVVDAAFAGNQLPMMARILKRVGLTLEVEERTHNELVFYAARRVVTNDISVPSAVPAAKAKGVA